MAEYEVPELKKGPALTEPIRIDLSIIFRNWPIWLILIFSISAGVGTFYYTDKIEKSIAVSGSLIGIAGIWLAYARLIMSYNQQVASIQQRERHHKEIMKQRDTHQGQTIDFYKKNASQVIITEWYKEFMQKSFVARNFRIGFTDSLGIVDLNGIREAIQKAEVEEIEILRKNDSSLPEEKLLIRKNIIPILNYFEKISSCILKDCVDEELLKDYFYDSFVAYQQAFQPLIDMRRNNYNGTPRAFKDFLLVIERWKDPK